MPGTVPPPFETLDPVGLKRLLDAQQAREEREAIRDVWRVVAFARAMGSEGVQPEDLLAELIGPERAREISRPARAPSKARQHTDEG